MDVVLSPDVYVNASVALGSPPDKVVQRVLGQHPGECTVTPWIVERITAMLSAVDAFKPDAVAQQVARIKQLVKETDDAAFDPNDWAGALVSAAKKANAKRVITDHPDLADQDAKDGIEFISTEAWLLEQAMPPPPPVP